MIGNVGIILAFCSALVSGILFFRQAISKKVIDASKPDYALLFYHLHFTGLLISAVYLFYALLSHQFQYYYVYAHTNLDLPLKYLVSAFWAGQEGTFILWALFEPPPPHPITLMFVVSSLNIASSSAFMSFCSGTVAELRRRDSCSDLANASSTMDFILFLPQMKIVSYTISRVISNELVSGISLIFRT